MYKPNKTIKTSISHNDSIEGESIESRIERIMNNKEPMRDGAPMIYTERKQGVLAETDIRTDRMEIAIEAMDKVEKSFKARRENRGEKKKEDGGTEPLHGKNEESKGDNAA